MNPGGGAAGWAARVRAALGLMHLSVTLVPASPPPDSY